MRETLRLVPPATIRTMTPNEDTTLGDGAYTVKAGVSIAIHTAWAQKDPAVWGDDGDAFRPERNLDGKFEALPVSIFSARFTYEDLIRFLHQPNAWQPFGFGMRACIVGLSLYIFQVQFCNTVGLTDITLGPCLCLARNSHPHGEHRPEVRSRHG